jgi:hypothetical protein
MSKPYIEEKISCHSYLRKFPISTPEEELKWHWDEEDRIVSSIKDTDWLFQFDNELPQSLNEEIFIPKGEFHRIIKGSEDLVIKVTKIF